MKIGTPYTPHATRVMLLGAGELGKEVIIALQRFGVEVIAVDRYPNAPGHQVAHHSHVIDMTDAKALRELIIQEKPQIIIPEIEAIATAVLIEIEKDHIAQIVPTAQAVQYTMNREGIRTLAAEQLNIPTSRYLFADNIQALKNACEQIGYPCFIKPVMSSSGKGQSKVNSADQVSDAWQYALQSGRVNRQKVIIEEHIEFDYEITLLTVRFLRDGQEHTELCRPIGHVQIDGDYVESWQPHPMSNKALANAQQIAKKVTDVLGGRGVFGVELFVKDDQVWFSEVSPRPHDTGMVTMITQAQNEFELHTRAILGLPVDVSLREVGASAVIYGDINAKGIEYLGLEKALQVPGTDVRIFGKPESFLKRRMGVALARGESIAQAREAAKLAASLIIPQATD